MTSRRAEKPKFKWPRNVFQKALAAALADIPDNIRASIENVSIMVENGPSDEGLLGLYVGTPINERGLFEYQSAVPDTITLYRYDIERISRTEQALRKNIRDTLIHEIAHYFGMSEADIEKRGFG
ncbi:MAG: metallopeptidase family protein [Spirochaetes bacterium]|nr:metallopeptidase family protein [Spirochaetota bacterium]